MQARLIYVVGPSGSGKDSLLRYARRQLADDPGVVFAHRYITRPADAGGENHIELTSAEFAARERSQLFALSWSSHGCAYGVGIEVRHWLARGATVVVNGSREYLPEARRRFADLLVVTIDVPTELLRQRLLARQREDPAAIEQRLARHAALQDGPREGLVIRNDGPLDRAGTALVALIRSCAGPTSCA